MDSHFLPILVGKKRWHAKSSELRGSCDRAAGQRMDQVEGHQQRTVSAWNWHHRDVATLGLGKEEMDE